MYQDFKELLSILNDKDVKYLVVGGYAVSFHAQPRATKDLDILSARHATPPPASVLSQALPQAFANSRTRKI
jgi:hypothetical protein